MRKNPIRRVCAGYPLSQSFETASLHQFRPILLSLPFRFALNLVQHILLLSLAFGSWSGNT